MAEVAVMHGFWIVCSWLGNVFRVDTRWVVFVSRTQPINTLVLIAFKPGASCTLPKLFSKAPCWAAVSKQRSDVVDVHLVVYT